MQTCMYIYTIMSQNNTNTQNSAETVATNEHLLTEILLHLPIKSLLRFKCVSKQWLNLISTTYFSINHSLKNPKRTTSISGLFMYRYPSLFYLNLGSSENSLPSFGPIPVLDFLKITPYATNLTILTSSNGLLLCLLVAPHCNIENDVIYFVCNPTTKKSNPLPPIQMLEKNPIVNMDLAFDPSESHHYRVICIRHLNPPDGPEFSIQIFSSGGGSWKTCRGPFLNIPKGTRFQGGVYWNKSIHYLNSWGGDSLYFSFEDEKLKSLKMPPMQSEIHTMKRSWHLGQTGSGSLNLVDIQTNITRDSSIDVYELKSGYSGWVIRFRVGLSAIEATFPEMVQYVEAPCHRIRVGRYYTYSVLSLVQRLGGDGDLVEIVLSMPNKIIRYDPNSNASKVLVYFGDDRDRLGYEWNNVVHYTESLSPV